MQLSQSSSEQGSISPGIAIEERQSAYVRLAQALEGNIGDHVSMGYEVPIDVVRSINSASSHAEVLSFWNSYLVTQLSKMPTLH